VGTTKATGKSDDAVQKDRISVWQQQEKLGELMAHYFKRLPPHEGVPRLIEKALELQRYVRALCLPPRWPQTLPTIWVEAATSEHNPCLSGIHATAATKVHRNPTRT